MSDKRSSKVFGNIALQGLLNKQGAFFHTWKTRWFVLSKKYKKLTYFTDANKQKQKGEIDLMRIKEIKLTSSPSNSFHITCTVPKRTYVIQATSVEKRKEWMDAIQAVRDGRPWPPKAPKKREPKVNVAPIVINNVYGQPGPVLPSPVQIISPQYSPQYAQISPFSPHQVVGMTQQVPIQHVSYNVQYVSHSAPEQGRAAPAPVPAPMYHLQSAPTTRKIATPTAPPPSLYGGQTFPMDCDRAEGEQQHEFTTAHSY